MRASQMLTGITKSLSNVTVPWRNGVVSKLPAYRGAPTATIVVKTSGANLDQLYRLFNQNGGIGYLELTADLTRAALFELVSIDAQGTTAADETVLVTVSVRFPTADWRAVAQTVMTPTTITDSPHGFNLMPGISAEINDADIFVSGNFVNFTLTDVGSGSWLTTRGTLPYVANSGVLYQGSTGRAFRATVSAPWTPGADLSPYIDVSGGGGFRITPDDSTGLDNPTANLTLVTGARTSLRFGFRAYNAYLLRNGDL